MLRSGCRGLSRCAFHVFVLFLSGGGVAAGPAGAAQEGGRAQRCAVSELVSGDGESEKQADHGVSAMPDAGNASGGRFTCQDDIDVPD